MRASNGTRRTPNSLSVASRTRLPVAAAALVLAAFLPLQDAGAAEFGDGSTRISVDTTLSHGMSWRASDPDLGLTSVNSDDGAKNYDGGLISNTSKITTEIEVDAENVGLFARFQGFYDFENRDGNRSRTQLSSIAKEDVGDGLDVLDFYATTSFEVGDAFVDLRLGSQVLNWGESTFIQNGINIINPFDVSKLRKPGAELRDGLLPVPMISVSADVTPNVTLEGFYQAGWQETKVDPAGTYFSTNDYGTPGGSRAYIALPGVEVHDQGQGVPSFNPMIPLLNGIFRGLPNSPVINQDTLLSISRLADQKPEDTGQWGAALRYYAEALNNTEFGLYFVNYHSRLPLASGQYGTLAGIGKAGGAAQAIQVAAATNPVFQGALAQAAAASGQPIPVIVGGLAQIAAIDQYGQTAKYRIEYPEDLQVIGLSFNTALGTTGWALQGEYSFHPDQPLQEHETSIFGKGLAPIVCALAPQTAGCPPPEHLPAFHQSVLGKPLKGYHEHDVSQMQATATRVFGPTAGADSWVFVAEAALVHVHNLPDPKELPIDTPGSYEDGATSNSYGYRLATRLDYNNAIGPATVSPYLQFQHDVNGYSPAPGGAFEEGRTALTLGVGVNYLERWRANLSFTNYNGDTNYLSDRDFVSFSLSYSF